MNSTEGLPSLILVVFLFLCIQHCQLGTRLDRIESKINHCAAEVGP